MCSSIFAYNASISVRRSRYCAIHTLLPPKLYHQILDIQIMYNISVKKRIYHAQSAIRTRKIMNEISATWKICKHVSMSARPPCKVQEAVFLWRNCYSCLISACNFNMSSKLRKSYHKVLRANYYRKDHFSVKVHTLLPKVRDAIKGKTHKTTLSRSAQWCVFNNYSLDKHRHQLWHHFYFSFDKWNNKLALNFATIYHKR